VYTTLISRNAGFHPSRYVGRKVSSRLHYLLNHTKADENMPLNIFPSTRKMFLVTKKYLRMTKKTQNTKNRPQIPK
jgi:hypothetical protein